jgi:hypothetical protein
MSGRISIPLAGGIKSQEAEDAAKECPSARGVSWGHHLTDPLAEAAHGHLTLPYSHALTASNAQSRV